MARGGQGKMTNSNKKKFEESEESELESGSATEYSQDQLNQAEEALNDVEISSETGDYDSQEGSGVSSESEEIVNDESESGSNSDATESGSAEEDDEVERTIFIKDIDYDLKEAELREQMQRLGELIRVTIPMTHDSRRNKGFAYVEFKRVGDAKKALKLNGTELLGRTVAVFPARKKENKPIFTVFVKNLSYDTTKDQLKEYFGKFGPIFNISLPIDPQNPERNKGFCFVEFNDSQIVKKIVAGTHFLNDRKLYLNEGNKNESRNEKRSNDKLYGRKQENRGFDRNNRSFNNQRRGNKKVFNDDDE